MHAMGFLTSGMPFAALFSVLLSGASLAANPTNCTGGNYDPPGNGGNTDFACAVSGNVGAITGLTLNTNVRHSFAPCINEHTFRLFSPVGTEHLIGTRNGTQSLAISTFNGQSSNGTWTLRVSDSNGNDACNDTVNSWSLLFGLGAPANPSLVFADTSLAENGAPNLRVRITTDGGGATTGTASVEIHLDADNPGSATSGSDFNLTVVELVIPAGTASGSLIPFGALVDDAALEYSETIGLMFANPSGLTVSLAHHDVTITDDETGAIAFVAATSTIGEYGTTQRAIPIRLQPFSSDGAATIGLSLYGQIARTSGSASQGTYNQACPNSDWSFFDDPVTFSDSSFFYLNASTPTYSPKIRVCADAAVDGGETIVFSATVNNRPSSVAAPGTHQVTIVGDAIFISGFD